MFVQMMTPWEFAPLYSEKTLKIVSEEAKLFAQAYGELLLMVVMHNAQEAEEETQNPKGIITDA